MARLSIGEALSDGFGLISRRPLDCMAWGLAYFVFAGVPSLLLTGWLLPDYLTFFREAMAHPDRVHDTFIGGSFAREMQLQGLQPLIWLGMLVGQAVAYSAVFRAVLRPQERGFLHLKLSSTELWVGLVLIVQYVCLWLTFMAMIIPVMILWMPTFITAANHTMAGWEAPVGLFGMFVAWAVLIWLCIRFSMAAPMSFAERQFRLFESWRLTRGKAFSLFLLYLVIGLIVMAVALIIEGIIASVALSVLGVNFNIDGLRDFLDQPPERIVSTAGPYVIAIDLVWAVIAGFFMAATVGAWASAYRQLAPAPAQP